MLNISFEFFPPKTFLGSLKLSEASERLRALTPKFISVTSTMSSMQNQLDVVAWMKTMFDSVAPHVLCDQAIDRSNGVLKALAGIGASQFVVLKGDSPSQPHNQELGIVRSLVSSFRSNYGEFSSIEVAAYPDYHPQNSLPSKDLWNLLSKIKYGASSTITQYFYAHESYYNFQEELQRTGASFSVTPGVMPVLSLVQSVKFSAQCGADVPQWTLKRLEELEPDTKATECLGIIITTNLCKDLLGNGIADFHFYALNNYKLVQNICTGLGDEDIE